MVQIFFCWSKIKSFLWQIFTNTFYFICFPLYFRRGLYHGTVREKGKIMLFYNTFFRHFSATFGIFLFWTNAVCKCQDLNSTSKHHISTEDFNELSFFDQRPSPPIAFSSRVKRQLNDMKYVYDTDTDEESGNWEPWQEQQQCSRTCG